MPGWLTRFTPSGRARMRRLLQQHLQELSRASASAAQRDEVREELRRYRGHS